MFGAAVAALLQPPGYCFREDLYAVIPQFGAFSPLAVQFSENFDMIFEVMLATFRRACSNLCGRFSSGSKNKNWVWRNHGDAP